MNEAVDAQEDQSRELSALIRKTAQKIYFASPAAAEGKVSVPMNCNIYSAGEVQLEEPQTFKEVIFEPEFALLIRQLNTSNKDEWKKVLKENYRLHSLGYVCNPDNNYSALELTLQHPQDKKRVFKISLEKSAGLGGAVVWDRLDGTPRTIYPDRHDEDNEILDGLNRQRHKDALEDFDHLVDDVLSGSYGDYKVEISGYSSPYTPGGK